jgi:hypothetical protein
MLAAIMDDRPDPPPNGPDAPLPVASRGQDGRFLKGASGNPRGNARRAPHKHTAFVRDLVAEKRPGIVRQVVEAAERGDPQAQALFFRYLGGAVPRRIVDPFELKPTVSARQAVEQIGQVIAKTAGGMLDLEGSRVLIDALARFVACFQAVELERRLVDADGYAELIEAEPEDVQ